MERGSRGGRLGGAGHAEPAADPARDAPDPAADQSERFPVQVQEDRLHIVVAGKQTQPAVRIVAEAAQNLKYTFHWLESGKAALRYLRTHAQSVDLLICPLHLPDMEGLDVLNLVRTSPLLEWLPVLMVSSQEGMDLVYRCLKLGADECLTWPMTVTELQHRVSVMLKMRWQALREKWLGGHLKTLTATIEDLRASLAETEGKLASIESDLERKQAGVKYVKNENTRLLKLADDYSKMIGEMEKLHDVNKSLAFRLALAEGNAAPSVDASRDDLDREREAAAHMQDAQFVLETPLQTLVRQLAMVTGRALYDRDECRDALSVAVDKLGPSSNLTEPNTAALFAVCGIDPVAQSWFLDELVSEPQTDPATSNGASMLAVAMLQTGASSERVPKILRSLDFDAAAVHPDDHVDHLSSIFHGLGVVQAFRIQKAVLHAFLTQICAMYRKQPFHNAAHALDAAQFLFYVLTSTALGDLVSALDVLALLIAAVAIDVGHPGGNNAFHVRARTPLGEQFNGISVLEQHHCTILFRILADAQTDILSSLSRSERGIVRERVTAMIVGTDTRRHFGNITRFNVHLRTRGFGEGSVEDRRLLCCALLYAADWAFAVRSTSTFEQWVRRYVQHLHATGDAMRASGFADDAVPIYCQRERVADENKMALNLLDFVVHPIFLQVQAAISGLKPMIGQIQTNRSVAQEQLLDAYNSSISTEMLLQGQRHTAKVQSLQWSHSTTKASRMHNLKQRLTGAQQRGSHSSSASGAETARGRIESGNADSLLAPPSTASPAEQSPAGRRRQSRTVSRGSSKQGGVKPLALSKAQPPQQQHQQQQQQVQPVQQPLEFLPPIQSARG